MKAWALLLLAGVSCAALAGEQPAANEPDQANVEHYHYGMDLDVARVIKSSEVSDGCGVEPAQLVYEDRQGQRHTLQYLVAGNGCSGG